MCVIDLVYGIGWIVWDWSLWRPNVSSLEKMGRPCGPMVSMAIGISTQPLTTYRSKSTMGEDMATRNTNEVFEYFKFNGGILNQISEDIGIED